jgi:hypothetical protein
MAAVPKHDAGVEIATFPTLAEADAAVAFLADDAVGARVLGTDGDYRLVVPRADAGRASVLLGLPSVGSSSVDLGAEPATSHQPRIDLDEPVGPWDEPLPPSSLWRRPPWIRLVAVIVVVGLVVPAMLSLLSLFWR